MAVETREVQAEDLETIKRVNAYEEWQKSEGAPVVTGFYLQDVNALELGLWERKGGRGAFVNLEGTGGVNDTHVVEIRPGGSSEPEHHMYEEMVYVTAGRGSTSVWYEGMPKHTFEWASGSVFAIPLNAWYQHFNASGTEPARYMAVTNAPTIISMFHNNEFVFNLPFAFNDRFAGEADAFSGKGKLYAGRIWETNFVPDARTIPMYEWSARGGRGSNVLLELAHNSMGAHISLFDVGTYKKAHRHGPGAHVIILDGVGFSFLWEEGDERTRCDWRPGSVVVPPEHWFHEHFNTGTQPVRYLALRFTGTRYKQPKASQGEGMDQSVKQGGLQIEYEDEDPSIHAEFEADLAKHGAVCSMKGLVPWCTGVSK